jgi:hypothetical protein
MVLIKKLRIKIPAGPSNFRLQYPQNEHNAFARIDNLLTFFIKNQSRFAVLCVFGRFPTASTSSICRLFCARICCCILSGNQSSWFSDHFDASRFSGAPATHGWVAGIYLCSASSRPQLHCNMTPRANLRAG